MQSPKFATAIVMMACLALPTTARADVTYWQHDPATPGDWFDQANWDNGVPVSGDYAYINNGGEALINEADPAVESVYYIGDDWVYYIKELCLGFAASDSGTVTQNEGYIYVYDNLYVGYEGTGHFNLVGGSIYPYGLHYIGYGPGSFGSFEMSAADAVTSLDFIGFHGTGHFTHTGGMADVSDALYLGYHPNSEGTYELSGTGEIFPLGNGRDLYVGYEGTGHFIQTGGIVNLASCTIRVGFRQGSRGTYELSGTGQISAGTLRVGGSDAGSFSQSGGTVTTSTLFIQCYDSGSTSSYALTEGSLSTYVTWILSGEGCTGEFIHSGGTHAISGALRVGPDNYGTGTYELSSTGELSSQEETICYGGEGTGQFRQSGGSNTTSYLSIDSIGRYEFTGGELTINGSLNVAGELDLLGSSVTIDAYNASMLNLSQGSIYGAEQATLIVGTNAFTVYATGHHPTDVFDNFINEGRLLESGSTLVVNPGEILDGWVGLVEGHIDCQGTINAIDYGWYASFDLQGGVMVSNGGTVNMGRGTLTVDNSISGINEGWLSAYTVYIGKNNTALFMQTGGDMIISGTSVPDGCLYVGRDHTGTYIHTGGTNTINATLYIGSGSGAEGRYELSGDAQLSANKEYVGLNGTGTFVQTGGDHTIDGTIGIGSFLGSSGIYTISGGVLSVRDFEVGWDYYFPGSGTLNIDDSAAQITVSNKLIFGEDSTFTAVPGATIHMTGADFEMLNTDEANLAGLANLHLIYEGGSEEFSDLEVACEDKGAVTDGYADNFALAMLTVGGVGIGMARLVDNTDNGNRGGLGGDAEAVYVDSLILNAGSVLDLDNLHLYWRTEFINNGGTVLNGHVRQVGLSGDFDADGDVDLDDYAIFADCMSGPGVHTPPADCAQEQFDQADLEGTDADVDLADFTIFQNAFDGI